MAKELENTDTAIEETTDFSVDNTGDEQETGSETANETATPNSELIELINENMEGADTSTPEALLASSLQLIKSLLVFQDKVRDLAETSPQTAAFLHDLVSTGNVGVALNENFNEEELTALLEEAKSNEYDEHRNNYATRVAEKNFRMAELESNKAKSQLSAQEFCDKYQPNDDELEEFIKFYDSILRDAVDNRMSVDHWERMWKAFKYDGTVSELENKVSIAEENGKIAGRNENIVQGKRNREDLSEILPETDGGATTVQPKKQNYIETLNQLHDSSSPLRKLKV